MNGVQWHRIDDLPDILQKRSIDNMESIGKMIVTSGKEVLEKEPNLKTEDLCFSDFTTLVGVFSNFCIRMDPMSTLTPEQWAESLHRSVLATIKSHQMHNEKGGKNESEGH